MKRIGPSAALAVLAALALLSMPLSTASALSLGVLTSGGSISSTDGAVTFDGFAVSFMDPIVEEDNPFANLDLSLIEVDVSEVGDLRTLTLVGPIDAASGDLGQLRIDYHVRAGDGFAIVGAAVTLEAKTFGAFSSASIHEAIWGDAVAGLNAIQSYDGASAPTSTVAFGGSARDLDVSNEIWMDGGLADGTRLTTVKQAFVVEQSSSPVPEPSAGLLFAAGTAIAALRVRRISRR